MALRGAVRAVRAVAAARPSTTRVASAAAAPRSVMAAAARAMSSESFKLPDLTYDYHELEPFVAAEIMELHHSKHHKTYVTNLNNALDATLDAQAKGDVAAAIALQGAIRFNGGGHINHSIFWENLAPPSKGGGGEPEGELKTYIDAAFGDFESFKKTFNAQTAAVQGSGWGWLGYNKAADRVEFRAMPNQDPLSMTGLVPLLGIDVWEHAYYLQYKNVRPDYLNAIWGVVNFGDVAAKLAKAKAK
mmetsp:Transcript_25100/g.87560  ORF Transcript_25100/g.87560 Transcript_25100/m.87560 type:complete len:246 (-) Transcript_25100:68-805(-)